jgi:hypothetical protein
MSAPTIPPELWSDDLQRAAAPPRWVWHGYLAAGAVTLLTSQWKSGKTTLLAVLLARLHHGGPLAGAAVAAGKAVVVSEEPAALWAERGRALGFGPHHAFLCRPFRGQPTAVEWLALLDRLAELHARHGLSLAVIDPLAAFLPGGDENSAAAMMAALTPLARLTEAGLSVLLLHHPRKEASAAGTAARGSGALPSSADVVIEMDWHRRGDPADRRRHLRAWSRFTETPGHRLIELAADGADYAVIADAGAEEFAAGWSVLRLVLEDAARKLTRQDVLRQWPADFEKPSAATLWRWLERAVAAGQVCVEGTGRRKTPFRYWLPGRDAALDELPLLEDLSPLENLPSLRGDRATLKDAAAKARRWVRMRAEEEP